ncbi:type VI secretion system-associated FHA domain protein TagH [Bradyrhizobium sp. INPA03-11B]|uniref:type VI secretion system-associated FHA domain protein TagH n=1 Tax=Bradyrhizobium sp. INPA03-11B TaxID=418598 RepID=UPI00338DB4D9
MHLILGVVGENAEPLGRNARQVFGPEGGSLGRGLGCTWQLPDPTNTLSASHALIAFNGVGFTITDTSTNGVYINTVAAPVGRANAAPLADGDTLYMASYIISVVIENDPAEERQRLGLTGSNAVCLGGATRALRSPSLAEERLKAPRQHAGQLTSDKNLPRDPLLAIGSSQPCSSSAAEVAPKAAASPQASAPPSCLFGDVTFINKAGAVESNLPTHLPPRRSGGGITETPSSHVPLGKPEPPLVGQSHRLPSAVSGGHGAPSARLPAPLIPDDLDLVDLLPAEASRGVPSVPPQRANLCFEATNEALKLAHERLDAGLGNDLATLRAPNPLVPRPGEDELERLAGQSEPAAWRPVGTSELGCVAAVAAPLLPAADELQGFWNALGFNSDLVPPAQRREFLAELGRALAEMANGLHSILTAWAKVKNECHIKSTRIRADNDNAFRFTKSDHDALRDTLAKDHGFLLLSRSVREGFDDIKAHEAAAIAAMRGTVSNLLTHMSPQRIESDGANSGRFGARINKAKLWDRFVELHAAMVSDIDRTARTYIAEEFARSYDSQVSTIDEDEGKTTDVGKKTSSLVRR